MTNPSSADVPTPATAPDPTRQQTPGSPAGAPVTPSAADFPTQAYPAPVRVAGPQLPPAPQPQPIQPQPMQLPIQPAQPAPQPHYQQPHYQQSAPNPAAPYPQPPYPQPQPAQPSPQYPAYPPQYQPMYAPQPQPQPATPYTQPVPYVTQQPQPQLPALYPSHAPPSPAPTGAPQPYQPQYQQPTLPPQPQPQQLYTAQPAPSVVWSAQGLQGGGIPSTRFEPQLGMQLQIGEMRFGFMPHPVLGADMEEVYVIEGGEALLYQVQDVATGALYALKVMKPSYRSEEIARSVASLLPYASQPGLQLGNRVCLTRAAYPELVAALPDLEYAVLMPWLMGRTWAGLLADRAASETYLAADALRVALRTAQALWELEAHHMAHTDVASGNVMLLSDRGEIALLDVETLYMLNTPAPRFQRLGTPGYQHPRLDARGQWRPDGDRFAGAILLAEMLAWWDPTVRALTPDGAESLFAPQELQSLTLPRWQAMRDALWSICPPTLALFDQAWASANLADCPELGAWTMVLLQQSAI